MDQVYRPAMSDLAVIAKTGKSWAEWFSLLDKAGALKLGHKSIVRLLGDKYRVGPWWRQMVTVEYERARGRRVMNQTTSGFSVSISRTIPAEPAAVFRAADDARQRRKWFPKGRLKISTRAADDYVRAAWNGARLQIDFAEKANGKTQVVVQVNRLQSSDDVERERALWKKALVKLEAMLNP